MCVLLHHVSTLNICTIIDCKDGDILLYDGTTLSTEYSNGTVLVCYDNEYGTVCDDFWDTPDAMVVCRFLGFESDGIYTSCHSRWIDALMHTVLCV